MRVWLPFAALPALPCAVGYGALSQEGLTDELLYISRLRCEGCWDAETQAQYGGCVAYASDAASWVEASSRICATYDPFAARECADELRARMETCTGEDLDEPLACEEAFDDCATPTATYTDSPAP